jgi:hypothetical protein
MEYRSWVVKTSLFFIASKHMTTLALEFCLSMQIAGYFDPSSERLVLVTNYFVML